MSSVQYNIVMIGCGKMGGAMLRAWVYSDLIANCYIVNRSGVPSEFTQYSNVSACRVEELADKSVDMVIAAVKPQIITEACTPVADVIDNTIPILSIAAGKSIKQLEHCFGFEAPIIRTMPNTPAAVGKGVCVSVENDNVTEEHKKIVNSLLGANGLSEWVSDEGLIDAVTGVSGSGPAYIFYIIEAMANAGEKAGLSTDMAMTLARQTVIGSAALADSESDIPASVLRENVTSPNGTTQAALNVLMDGRMLGIFEEVVSAAKKRAAELNS